MHKAHAYRRDIDGLRALAVLPVVIFHIAQSYLPGGYVGVDVFFVISGYLISAHIISDAKAGNFSPWAFYNRRIRRIIPAFLVMLVVVTAMVLWRFFPPESEGYAHALLAAMGSGSNIYFMLASGYFAPAAEALPLLHTWSLGVEEQFYVVFPLIVLGVIRFAPHRLATVVVIVLLASFALSMVSVSAFPLGGFYLLPTRAWEILIGTVLALGVIPDLRSALTRNVAGLLGLALIGGSMLLYTPSTPFPGIAALVPCLGAALVIHSGRQQSWVTRVLSFSPLVFVGLISYSLYLWHWPIMVFQRAESLFIVTDSKILERGVVLAASITAAILSWWLVERPTRNRRLVTDRALLIGVVTGFVVLGATGVTLIVSDGWPGRFPAPVLRMASWLHRTEADADQPCFFQDDRPFSSLNRATCLPDRPDRPTYLIVGDSHAGALAPAIRAEFPDANILEISAADCLPTLPPNPGSRTTACNEAMSYALETLPKERPVDAIWLVGRFGHDNIISRRVDAVAKTAKQLTSRGIRVVVVGPNPEYTVPLPRLLARSLLLGTDNGADRQLSGQPFEADRLLRRAAESDRFGYVSLTDAVCEARRCRVVTPDGSPLLFDTDHATPAGARLFASIIRDDLRNQSRRP